MARGTRKPKRRTAKKPANRRPGFFRRLLPYVFLLCCLGAVVLAAYAVYLDGEVRSQFEGTRWTLPAKVYAAPLELYAGLDLSRADIVARLKRQGYRDSSGVDNAGTYHSSGSRLDIHTRPFTFWDGDQGDREIRLGFNSSGVSSLQAIDKQGDLALIRLDPLMIGSIYPAQGEDRILVKLGEVPPMLPAGLITVEDRDFLHHWGVSPKSILRAAFANMRAGHVVQGGSTITQQLVKNFYLNNQQTLVRKAKEALMAVLLDAHYSKPEILEAYLNEVYLGQDGGRAIHGFGLASYFYFQKPLEELQPNEIALLVAMVKGPSYYSPRRNPKRALARRNLVLDMFHSAGFLEDDAWAAAKKTDLGVTTRSVRSTSQYPAFIDLVRRQLHGQYKDADLTNEGLRIFTTLDPTIQAATEARVNKGLDDVERARGIKKDSLQSAAVVTSVEGGRVLALVGGRDAGYAGFNRALDARRPIGSLMKPVVYLTALSEPSKYNVITPLDDGPLAVKLANGDTWRPQNYSKTSHGHDVPLHYALTHSYNLATARLAIDVGIPNVVDTLKKLGYTGDPLAVPSLALGAVGMAPLQVAQVYNTLAAGGYYTPLLAIRDVTTRDGEPLARYPLQIKRVVDEAPVYLTDWVMQRVARYGTGASMYNVLPKSLNLAGKTGTTDDLRDSWFAGFGANRLAVVWVGRDDNQPAQLTGATGALQLWTRIMSDVSPRGLLDVPPEDVVEVPLRMRFNPAGQGASGNQDLYQYAQSCGNATPVPFTRGYVPDGLSGCDSDIMRENAARKSREQEDEGNWLQKIFR
ncbi:penicillin-binding protein 1B [Salinisphaera aquimarina]|uniref:Penicillin-binding protein 1B n=1 Tax=Salinisphaera aquimarina TaxID=2094031 RepID=A0ABV7ESB9_9GAMM